MTDVHDAPVEALPEVDRLIGDILDDRGYETGADPEIDRELAQAREIAERVDAGEDVDPGDVAAALNGYEAIYESLLTERRAP